MSESTKLQQINRYAAELAARQDVGEMTFTADKGSYSLVRPNEQRIRSLGYQAHGSIVTSVGNGANPTRWPLIGGPASAEDLNTAVQALMDSAKMLPPA